MKIVLLQLGKTDKDYLLKGVDDYIKRINRLAQFETITIPDLKNRKSLNISKQLKKEGEAIRGKILKGDYVIMLDERGKGLSSIEFAETLDSLFQSSSKRIVFVIGGPYGLDSDLRKMANMVLSLSDMTFSHQLVRLLFAEQLYRALSILGGLPYHNE